MSMDFGASCNKLASLLNLPDELISKLPRRIDNPLSAPTIEFLVTNRCNLKCKYCYSYFGELQEDLSPEIAISFLDSYLSYQKTNCIRHDIRRFVFSGGEPTLNPDTIFKVTEYVDKNRIKCIPTLLSNGVISSTVLEKLIEKMFYFQISFDGKNNMFRTTSNGIEVHDQIVKSIIQISNAGLPIDIRAVITKENVSNMVDIVKFAADNNVDSVLFAPASIIANAIDFNIERSDVNEYLANLKQAIKIAKKLNVNIPMAEKSRFEDNGEYVELPRLLMFPDGSITMMTIYTSIHSKGVEHDIIGKCTVEEGLIIDLKKVKKLVLNYIKNLDLHCKPCECYKYCKGRTIDNCYLLISKENLAAPEEYFCEVSKGIYNSFK